MQPRRVLLVATSFVLALAAWVSRGALAVTDAASWPRRIAILPSRWVPPVLALVFLVALWRARRSTLLVLLIPAILLLPWLPIPVPAAALAWTGHAMQWVWIVTALAAIAVAWPRWYGTRIVRALLEPRTGSFTALALAFVLYCTAAWSVADVVPGGDEPHYLVITQSLLADGDLQIENNHKQGDYRPYFPADLRPDFLRRGKNGEIYSIHAPGLSALVLPAFAVGGYRGVVGFLALLSAFGTWLVWRAGYRLTRSAGAAWFGWSCVALSVPFLVHAFTVYPDAAGATIVMAAVSALVAFECVESPVAGGFLAEWGTRRWALLGGALALLPWLHTRYAGAAALLGGLLTLRLLARREYGKAAAFIALPLLSAAGWFGYFYAVYGEFSPAAPYGHYTQSSPANIPRGLPALLFDQQFGVLPNAPAYATALLGLGSLFRLSRRLAIEIGLLLVSYLLLVSAYFMWWGGWSAPARFLVPVLLMLGVPAAVFWSRQRAAGKAMALTALGVSALITTSMVFATSGQLIFNNRDGVALWLEWLNPVVDLPRALPSFLRDATGKALSQTIIWVFCAAIGALVIRRAVTRRPAAPREDQAGGLAVRTLLVFGAVVMVAGTATWRSNRVGGATPSSSTLALLRAYHPAARPVGVRFMPFGRVPIADVPAQLSLPVSNRRPADAEGPLLVLFDVPPGVYRLSSATVQAAQGSVVVTIGRSRQAIARWTFDPSARGGDVQFTLPVAANAVVISGDALARRSMPRIALEPVSVVPEVWRFTARHAARAARYDDVVAFTVEDPGIYVEDNGIWVAGGVSESIAFAGPAGAPVVRFLLRNSPVDNEVTLRGPVRTDVFTMKPGEIRVVELPVDRYNGGAMVEVTSARGYRPADVDKTTQDRRYLGVWIQNVPK